MKAPGARRQPRKGAPPMRIGAFRSFAGSSSEPKAEVHLEPPSNHPWPTGWPGLPGLEQEAKNRQGGRDTARDGSHAGQPRVRSRSR
jgi:hypothetical protein